MTILYLKCGCLSIIVPYNSCFSVSLKKKLVIHAKVWRTLFLLFLITNCNFQNETKLAEKGKEKWWNGQKRRNRKRSCWVNFQLCVFPFGYFVVLLHGVIFLLFFLQIYNTVCSCRFFHSEKHESVFVIYLSLMSGCFQVALPAGRL